MAVVVDNNDWGTASWIAAILFGITAIVIIAELVFIGRWLEQNKHIEQKLFYILARTGLALFIMYLAFDLWRWSGLLSALAGTIVVIGVGLIKRRNNAPAPMDIVQAEIIVKAYGGAIAQNTNVFKRQSTLPYPKGMIRDAFHIYIAEIIDLSGTLPKEHGEQLIAVYSMMDAFVPDKDADRLNRINEQVRNKQLDAGTPEVKEYFSLVPNALRNPKHFDEINDYIKKCYKEKGGACHKEQL